MPCYATKRSILEIYFGRGKPYTKVVFLKELEVRARGCSETSPRNEHSMNGETVKYSLKSKEFTPENLFLSFYGRLFWTIKLGCTQSWHGVLTPSKKLSRPVVKHISKVNDNNTNQYPQTFCRCFDYLSQYESGVYFQIFSSPLS